MDGITATVNGRAAGGAELEQTKRVGPGIRWEGSQVRHYGGRPDARRGGVCVSRRRRLYLVHVVPIERDALLAESRETRRLGFTIDAVPSES